MAKKIMFQGTSSNVGKSILATAFCRIFYRRGLKTVPFKAQNMALNSYVTKWGDEIGRAQVAQAEAAGIDPIVQMNPVLLKPTGNQSSQVVLMGKPVGVYSAQEYHTNYSLKALDKVKESFAFLDKNYEMIVIEGAGSPAEVNLKANDIVNMRVAKMGHVPVMLIADIDRGGAIASVVGTLELLEPEERDLVKGIIINKFRGDVTLLHSGIEQIEALTGVPVLGVMPWLDVDLEDEDGVALQKGKYLRTDKRDIDIAVVQIPHISNFTDFNALAAQPDVRVRYVRQPEELAGADLVLSGHVHAPLCRPLAERYGPVARGCWTALAGTATSRRLRGGHPNSVNVIRHALVAGERRCSVERLDYDEVRGAFRPVAVQAMDIGG